MAHLQVPGSLVWQGFSPAILCQLPAWFQVAFSGLPLMVSTAVFRSLALPGFAGVDRL